MRGGEHLLEGEYKAWEENGKKGTPPKTGREHYNDIVMRMEREGMSTLADLLRVYNNDDTKPFVFDLNEILPKASENCRICNETIFESLDFKKCFTQNEICPRCNLSLNFSNQIMNVNIYFMIKIKSKSFQLY